MYLSDEPIMSIYWYSYHVQSYIGSSLAETATKLLNLATTKCGWLGRTCRGWTGNLSLVPLPGLIYLSDELILSVYWYSSREQPYMAAFLHCHPESPHDWGLDKQSTLFD